MSANVISLEAPLPGHNLPPEDMTLEDRLKRDYAGLLDDVKTWTDSAGRAPAIIKPDDPKADDLLLGLGRLVLKLRDIMARADKAHEAEKKPYLEASRSIDGFFLSKGIRGLCEPVIKKLEAIQTAYTRAKEAAIRARAEAEELERREAAERALELARHAEDHGEIAEASSLLGTAAAQETLANEAAHVASASTADVVRTRSASLGVTVSASSVWTFEVEDWSKVDLNELKNQIAHSDVEKAIRAYVKLGGRQLQGVRIFETQRVINRG